MRIPLHPEKRHRVLHVPDSGCTGDGVAELGTAAVLEDLRSVVLKPCARRENAGDAKTSRFALES